MYNHSIVGYSKLLESGNLTLLTLFVLTGNISISVLIRRHPYFKGTGHRNEVGYSKLLKSGNLTLLTLLFFMNRKN